MSASRFGTPCAAALATSASSRYGPSQPRHPASTVIGELAVAVRQQLVAGLRDDPAIVTDADELGHEPGTATLLDRDQLLVERGRRPGSARRSAGGGPRRRAPRTGRPGRRCRHGRSAGGSAPGHRTAGRGGSTGSRWARRRPRSSSCPRRPSVASARTGSLGRRGACPDDARSRARFPGSKVRSPSGRGEETVVKAWVVHEPGAIDHGPLALVDRPRPEPGAGEVRVAVSVCGVCRTDLHLAEGDLAPHGTDVVPGHEVVGVVDALGPGARRFEVGERIGIAWLRQHVRDLPLLRAGATRTCASTRASPGWDADGGYAEYAVVDERYAYRLPDGFSDERGGAAAVRRHHRLPRAAARRAAPRRPARHLRLRRLGPPGRPGGPRRGCDRARDDPVGRGPAAGARPGRRVGGRRVRRAARAARRRHPVRPGRRARPRGARRPRPRRHRWPSPASTSATSPRSTTSAHLFQERQLRSVTANTRARRRGVPRRSRPRSASGSRPRPTRWSTPTGPWPTWPTTGSRAPPCCASGAQEARGERFRATFGLSARL